MFPCEQITFCLGPIPSLTDSTSTFPQLMVLAEHAAVIPHRTLFTDLTGKLSHYPRFVAVRRRKTRPFGLARNPQ
jgi:hypothetical protein